MHLRCHFRKLLGRFQQGPVVAAAGRQRRDLGVQLVLARACNIQLRLELLKLLRRAQQRCAAATNATARINLRCLLSAQRQCESACAH